MTLKNDTNSNSTENERDIQFIRVLTKSELFSMCAQVFIYGWTGGILLSVFILTLGPEVFSMYPYLLYVAWFSVPAVLIFALLRRNHFLTSRFNEKNHRMYLEFSYRWRILILTLTLFLIFYYFIYGFHDPRFYTLALAIPFFNIPIFLILDRPLTKKGEIYILFEMLSSSLNNFDDAQHYWTRIAKRIERMFKTGNIKLSRKDLIYNFSKTFLDKTKNISKDLPIIRDWLLGRTKTCLDELSNIYPQLELQPCKMNVFLEWLIENPETMLNYLFKGILIAAIVILSVFGLNPGLIGDIL